jgi:hypothetical protein
MLHDFRLPVGEVLECCQLLIEILDDVGQEFVPKSVIYNAMNNFGLLGVAASRLIPSEKESVALAAATLLYRISFLESTEASSAMSVWRASGALAQLTAVVSQPDFSGTSTLSVAMNTLWHLTNIEPFAMPLVESGLVSTAVGIVVAAPRNESAFPSSGLPHSKIALSMVCNLAMWPPARRALIAADAVAVLTSLLALPGYGGVRATMGIACLVGQRDEQSSHLLVARPEALALLATLLDSAVRDEPSEFQTVFNTAEVPAMDC